MMRIAIATLSDLPVPPSKGGAVETLIELLATVNETFDNNLDINEGDYVIVETEKGTQYGKVVDVNVENTNAETVSSPEAEQLFETFKAAEEETNVQVAKQQDVIAKLQAKIEDTIRSQSRQNQTVTACETLLQSNAYPKLNPLITAFSDSTKKSSENKNQKIKKLNLGSFIVRIQSVYLIVIPV